MPAKKTRRFCINCDNRHGCRTEDPPCLAQDPAAGERLLPGKELMRRRGLLRLCRACGHFRQCWSEETFRRQAV